MSEQRQWKALFVLPVLAATVVACSPGDDPVAEWLACDCPLALHRTVALGDAAIESLDLALRNNLTDKDSANFRSQVGAEYRLARRFRDSNPAITSILSDTMSYVGGRLDDMVADYQKRAALALRGVGTPMARQKLHWASLDQIAGNIVWRSDVTALVARLDSDFPVMSVTVRSPVSDLPPGGSAQLTARVRGGGLVPQLVTWSSSNVALVSVTGTGVATRVAGAGSVSIRACSTVSALVCGSVLIGTQ